MALLKVGIHENLKLTDETKVNDKGSLEIHIESAADAKDAILEAFTSNSVYSPMKGKIIMFPPNMKTFDGVVKDAGAIAADLLKVRHQLMSYAKVYASTEKVNAAIGGMKMLEGLGIPADELGTAVGRLTNEDFMIKVNANLGKKFVEFLKEVNAFKGGVTFRQKFLRQSKDKNYAVIPTSDYDVWIESMDIPKSASKVAYSKWELANKKNDPNPSAGDAPEAGKEDANKGKNLFGGGAAKKEQEQPEL
jgi:hypothetical protein